MKYKTGLVIGRFQPFHNGHLYLLRKALQIADMIVIGLGSANIHDADNPLSASQRKALVERVLREEEIEDRVQKIVAIDDGTDDAWLRETLQKAGDIDVIVGNTDWTNTVFKEAGYPIQEVPFWKRYLYEGKRIRQLIRRHKPWEKRVPHYLVPIIKKFLS